MPIRRYLSRATLPAGLLVGLLLVACSSEDSTPTPVGQVAASPPPATESSGPLPTATPPSEDGPLQVQTPTDVPAPTETPPPSATPPCTNQLVFLNDVTVPDGAHFLPGQPIDKKWAVRNAGTCDWTGEYRVVLVNGDGLGARTEIALFPARAGTEAIVEVPMVAPGEPGEYTGRWQARDPDGQRFGNVFFIKIQVIPVPPPEAPPP